jgi:hypothetical protein
MTLSANVGQVSNRTVCPTIIGCDDRRAPACLLLSAISKRCATKKSAGLTGQGMTTTDLGRAEPAQPIIRRRALLALGGLQIAKFDYWNCSESSCSYRALGTVASKTGDR